MDTYSLVAASVLALWLAVSILLQFPQLQRFRSADALALIPDFSFFASDAPPGDYCLVYRSFLSDGTPDRWIELRPGIESRPGKDRRWWSALWNPDRRHRRAMRDACSRLDGQAHALRQSLHLQQLDTVLYTSLPYLTLLTYVSGIAEKRCDAQAVQFAVLLDHGPRTSELPIPIFVSSLHRLIRRDQSGEASCGKPA